MMIGACLYYKCVGYFLLDDYTIETWYNKLNNQFTGGRIMPVVQVTMEISEEAARGIAAGVLKQTGGVIRDNAGHIFEHLKDAKIVKPQKQVAEVVKPSLLNVLKDNKNLAIGIGVVTVVAIGAASLYVHDKIKKNKQDEIPEIKSFNDSLIQYIMSAQNKKMSYDDIDSLYNELDKMKSSYDAKTINIDFSIEQLDSLIDIIVDYTKRLVKANQYEAEYPNFDEVKTPEDKIVYLSNYLKIQKDIFNKTAS